MTSTKLQMRFPVEKKMLAVLLTKSTCRETVSRICNRAKFKLYICVSVGVSLGYIFGVHKTHENMKIVAFIIKSETLDGDDA